MLLVVTLMISLLAFTACGNNNSENGDKQVPVYQGMTITKADSAIKLTSASCYSSGIVLLSSNNGNNGDNGNHYGHYKGDHTDRNDTIDEDNPYPDNNANENIEEEIKSSLNVVGSPDEIYYATPNEDIYINIHIDNPDSFEIMSFTLNGKKYSSYMFEEGSDMETIVLKYNVGDATGIVEYTIDAIKYIDGTEIKDVIIDGNKTVMAGIRTENQVVASVTDVDIDTNVLSFKVNVKDNNSLVEFSKGALKAVIYDGFNIISEKDIAVGNNSVIFDGLKTNTVYQYAVVGYYDDLSGGGFGMNVLYKDAFYTDSVVLFDNITVGQESISFGYLWHEDHQGKAISALKLYKGDAFIKDITASATTVNELLSGTTYKLVAEYPNADKTESIYLEFATLAKATPEVSVFNPTKTQTSVNFEIVETDADNVGTVTNIELYKDGQLVETAANLDVRSFVGLLSNNTYTVKITYTYNLNGGVGDQTEEKTLDIKTDAKATPVVSITNPTQTQTSVGFEISETDADNIGSVTKIELYKDGQLVKEAESLDGRSFVGLLSNNTYTVKITYTYNLNDGTGNQTEEKTLDIKTDAKAVPIFTVKNENATADSVTAEYDIIDVDKILSYYKVELYKGNTLVLENANNKIDFTGLDCYTNYTVKITCTYDLNDGNGEQTVAYDYAYKTLPYIDVVECNVANTSAVSEGETIFMSVKLDNPLGMTIESVVINGETYSVTGASTKNKIFVEIVYNGQFAGGDTYLKINKVNAKIDSTTLSVEPESELSDNVFINGKLEVLKIEFVNENFEPIDWAFPSEKVYVMITLNNSTGYTVNSINDNIIDLIKVDNSHWYFEYDNKDYSGWHNFILTSLVYSNDYIRKSISHSDMNICCYVTTSNEKFYIRNASDLKNMNSGYYYELANDIDLGEIEWDGDNFNGVFDGMGYAIKNMSFVGNIKNSDAYLGLFDSGSGVVQNLNIKDATIIADIATSDEGEYVLYCGGLIAYSDLTKVNNCIIDANSVISIRTDSGITYAGGLIGYISAYSDAFLNNCINGSEISVKSSKAQAEIYAGGLIGGINNTGYVLYSNHFVNIINCLNYGNITTFYENDIGWYYGAGAFIGIASMLNDSSKLIINSMGSLNIGQTDYKLVGRTVYDNLVFIETYSLCVSDTTVVQGKLCTVEQLNSKSFYTETLGWSEDVWDFSELDVENGKYPQLK